MGLRGNWEGLSEIQHDDDDADDHDNTDDDDVDAADDDTIPLESKSETNKQSHKWWYHRSSSPIPCKGPLPKSNVITDGSTKRRVDCRL